MARGSPVSGSVDTLLHCRQAGYRAAAAASAVRRLGAEVLDRCEYAGDVAACSWIRQRHQFAGDFCIELTVSSERAAP